MTMPMFSDDLAFLARAFPGAGTDDDWTARTPKRLKIAPHDADDGERDRHPTEYDRGNEDNDFAEELQRIFAEPFLLDVTDLLIDTAQTPTLGLSNKNPHGFASNETEADERIVVSVKERKSAADHADARFDLVSRRSPAEEIVCDVQRDRVRVLGPEGGGACVVCQKKLSSGQRVVRGCGLASHEAHAACHALVCHTFPHVSGCVGAAVCPCVDAEFVQADVDELRALNRKVRQSIVQGEIPLIVAPHTSAIVEKQLAVAGQLACDKWLDSVPSAPVFYTPSERRTAEMPSKCAVCDAVIHCGETHVRTCKNHHTHQSCYVLFRALREKHAKRAPWSRAPPTDCPGTHFNSLRACEHPLFLANREL